MNSSLPHNFLSDAWKLTTHATKIRRFNFFGSLLDTLILSEVIVYQVAYVWIDVMGKKSEFFSWLREFWIHALGGEQRTTWITSLLGVGLIYFFINFFFKNIFNAGLVYLIDKYHKRDEKSYRTMKAFTFGWRKSVKLAEYHSLLFWSKPVYILYIFFYWYRFFEGNWWVIWIIATIFLIALILTRFFFEYAKLFITLEDNWVFDALGKSIVMTIENPLQTARLFFSLVLVYLREVVLVIGIFFLPFLISWLVALGIGKIFLQGVFLVVGLVYLCFLIIVSAANSIIEIFVESLWYQVFLENLAATHNSHSSSHSSSSHH